MAQSVKNALPTRLKEAMGDGEANGGPRHHGKTQSHVVSTFFLQPLALDADGPKSLPEIFANSGNTPKLQFGQTWKWFARIWCAYKLSSTILGGSDDRAKSKLLPLPPFAKHTAIWDGQKHQQRRII